MVLLYIRPLNSLVSKENVPEMIVGFIPVIPFPVTEYQTVYTALKNFQDILKQLDQTHLPVACDEGVYHIARSITMESPREFENIVLVLGGFHMVQPITHICRNFFAVCKKQFLQKIPKTVCYWLNDS